MYVNLNEDESARLTEALQEVNASIGSTLEFDEIMRRVMVTASHALLCQTAGILLRDGDSWVVRYVYGFPADIVGRRFDAHEMPHAQMAMDSRSVFVVPDALSDQRVPAARMREFGVAATMVVPLVAWGEAIGAIFFNYAHGPVDFSAAEVEFGQKLAASLSLALDNARLYDAERQGRALFQTMFEHAPAGILLMEGPDLRVVTANQAFLEFLDEPTRSKCVPGIRLVELSPQSETNGGLQYFLNVGRTGKPEVMSEYYSRHPTRGDTYWRWTVAPVPAPGGPQPKVMFLVSDITQEVAARKRAEELAGRVQEYAVELEQANANLRNQAEELEVQSEELRQQNDELVTARAALEQAHLDLEFRVRERTAELAAANAALTNREASLRQVAEALENQVAERRRAEVELAQQAAQLRDQAELLELTNDTILVRDLKAHILYWNRGAEQQYGWQRDEVMGLRSHVLLKTEFPQPVSEVYDQLLKTGRWDGELVHTRRDGQRITVASRWALQRNEQGQPVRVLEINNDITAHKQAEQELWRHTKRLQILHEIDLAVLAARSVRQLAQAAAEHMRQLVPCQRVAVIVFDFERQVAHRLAVASATATQLGAGTSVPLSEYDFPPEHQQGRVYAVADATTMLDPSSLVHAFMSEGIRSYISVPLMVQGRLTGLLNLAANMANRFTIADVDVARQVADSLAVALEQARLYEGEHQAREVAETLRAANNALTQSLDLDTVLDTLLTSLQRLVPYNAAQVLLLEDDACLVMRARRSTSAAGLPEGLPVPTRILNADDVPAFQVPLSSGRSLLIPDTTAYPGWERTPMLDEARNWLGVPLVAGSQVLGICSIYGSEPGAFTAEHTRLAEALAGQAAVAIQNARLFREVDAGRQQLQALSRRLVDVQEEERRYIARELHDEAGQVLTSLMVSLGLLGRELADRPELAERVLELKKMTDGTMEALHRLAMRLRPATLDRLGLVPALRQYVESFLQENNLAGEFLSMGVEEIDLPPEVEITLYRVVQEALTNVSRHAQASYVEVLLERRDDDGRLAQGEPDGHGAGQAARHVLAIIEDNGVGFDPVAAGQRGRLGLFGMQERAEMLGGTCQVESSPGEGTTVFVEIPY